MIVKYINEILVFLKHERGFDFSGYRIAMLERRIQKRIFATKSSGIVEYLEFLKSHPEELEFLLDVLTINVSSFFRDPLCFEYLNKYMLPDIINKSIISGKKDLRIWSAGCSTGEEPYSLAILLKELLSREKTDFSYQFFATDIDHNALRKAIDGIYELYTIKEIPYKLVLKYFKQQDEKYQIDQCIREMVHFSIFDLLSHKQSVPPESIFGSFDIVLCRNVLIYFNVDHQKFIFNKLYKSLNKGGILILGESELPPGEFHSKFSRINSCCKIYRKTEK